MTLDGHEMQARAPCRIRLPRGPGGHEIESEAEAGFDDGEYARAATSRGQIVAVNKNVSRLIRARFRAVIDVPELLRKWSA